MPTREALRRGPLGRVGVYGVAERQRRTLAEGSGPPAGTQGLRLPPGFGGIEGKLGLGAQVKEGADARPRHSPSTPT